MALRAYVNSYLLTRGLPLTASKFQWRPITVRSAARARVGPLYQCLRFYIVFCLLQNREQSESCKDT